MLKPKQITAKQLAHRIEREIGSMRSYGRFTTSWDYGTLVNDLRRDDLSRQQHQELADQWTELNRRARRRYWHDIHGLPDPLARAYEIVDVATPRRSRRVDRVPATQIREQADRWLIHKLIERMLCQRRGHRWMPLEYTRDVVEIVDGVSKLRQFPGQAYIGCGRCLAEFPG